MPDDPIRWLIVMTRPNAEIDVLARLRKQGFRVWHWHCMRDEIVNSRRRKTRRAARSYLSRYLFVRDTAHIDLVNDTEGVSTVLTTVAGADGETGPMRVPDASLRALADFLGVEEDGYVPEREPPAPPSLPGGATVKPIHGPFMGFLGTVERSVPLDGKARIRAFLDIFGRPTAVEFEQGQVEVVSGP